MKKNLLMLIMFCATGISKAQFQFNPQIGITAQSLSNEPDDVDQSARIGYTIGADGRMGKRFYFQPGMFYGKSSTEYKTTDEVDTLNQSQIENQLDRTIFTVKLFGGYHLVDKDGFKLRINAGPSIDFITKVEDEKDLFEKSDFNLTLLNFKAAVGVDIWFLTAELGYGWGITNAFDDRYGNEKSKFNQLYLTVGVVLGSNKH
ncbi:MAG: porin family protein [Bacteroidia bacterium]